MEIKGNFFNFNNDDNLRAKKTPKSSPAPKKEEAKTENKAPVDPRYWQQRAGISFGNKETTDSAKTDYCKLLEDLCKESPMDSSFTYNLKNEGAEKLYELIRQGKFTPENISDFTNKLYLFTYQDRENIEGLVSVIYNFCTQGKDEQENSKNSEFVQNITMPRFFMGKIKPAAIAEIIKESSPNSREFTKFFAQMAQKTDFGIFADANTYNLTLGMLDENNFEQYKASFVKRSQTSTPLDLIYKMTLFENPVTGKYDPKIDDATSRFYKKKKQPEYSGRGFLYSETDAAAIIRAMVDGQTGEISEKAVKFTNDYYFAEKKPTENKGPLSKIKSFFSTRFIQAEPYYLSSLGFHDNFETTLNEMKDNTGAFNDKNIEYMSKLLETKSGWRSMNYQITFFNLLKDENGVVDRKKFSFAQKVLEETNDLKATEEVLEVYKKYGKKNFDSIYKFAKKLYEKSSYHIFNNIGTIARNCFNEDGTQNEKNLAVVKEMSEQFDCYIEFSDEIFSAMNDEYLKGIIQRIKTRTGFSTLDINALAEIKKNYSDESGEILPHTKEKLEEYLNTGTTANGFSYIYHSCFSYDKNPKGEFDEKLFQDILSLLSAKTEESKILGKKLFAKLSHEDFISLAKGDINPNSIKFKTKVTLYEELKRIDFNKIDVSENPTMGKLKKLFYEIDASLTADSHFLPVKEEYAKEFIHTIFSKGKDGNFSEFETAIKNSLPKLKEMEDGLPLKYSRERFLSDLSNLLDSKEKIKAIENKLDVNFSVEENNGKFEITGYEGILTLDKLDKSNDFESSIYFLCHKFMYENEITTGDENLDKELNIIIKAAPEFINCIGKKQHGTHKYTLDIHQLSVLANSINDPNYKNLNDLDRAMLKITAIFHDIAKQEGVVDKGHQEPSALYARGIIKKFMQNPETVERVYELIKNHHWSEEFATSGNKEKTAQEIAFKFRRPNDFEIVKIMARADLMSVGDDFYEKFKDSLSDEKLDKIDQCLQSLYSGGGALFTDYIISPTKLEGCKETFENQEYKVVNFHNIKDDDSLMEYGFRNIKKKDAKFLVHMLPENSIDKYIETIKQLTSSVNGGVLSESIITPKYKRTYCNRKFGVLLSQINPNIVTMANKNQGSGTSKDIEDAVDLIFSPYKDERKNFKNKLLENLSINPDEISDKDYADFYRECMANKTSLCHFVDSREYQIGRYKVTGKQIKEAVEKYQDELIDKKEEYHNEIVGYVPKIQGIIAKAKGLDEVPKELLDFAKKNDYPIILI